MRVQGSGVCEADLVAMERGKCRDQTAPLAWRTAGHILAIAGCPPEIDPDGAGVV